MVKLNEWIIKIYEYSLFFQIYFYLILLKYRKQKKVTLRFKVLIKKVLFVLQYILSYRINVLFWSIFLLLKKNTSYYNVFHKFLKLLKIYFNESKYYEVGDPESRKSK